MKNLIALLLIASQVFLTPVSVAALSDVDKQFVGYKNLLTNGGFESSKAGWVATTATLTTDSTNYFEGKASGLLTFSASTGDATATITPGGQYAGVNMEASCMVKTSLSTIQVCAVQAGVESNCSNVPATGSFTSVPVSFIGASGSVAVKVKTTASTTGTVNIDGCYVGQSRGIGTLPPAATLIGSATWVGSTSCVWTRSAVSSYASFPAVASCTFPSGSNLSGSASAPSTKIPAITFATLPAGDYEITASGAFSVDQSRVSYWAFYDGTTRKTAGGFYGPNASGAGAVVGTTSVLSTRFSYSSAQSNITFEIQANGSASVPQIVADTAGSNDLTITVKYFPSSSTQQVINSNVTPSSWSGYHLVTGAWSAAGGTYSDPSNATGITLNQSTNRNFGTVSTASGSVPGITFTPPRSGNYRVTARVAGYVTSAGNNGSWRLVDGAGTVIDPGISLTTPSNTSNMSIPLSGIYTVTSTSPVTFKVQVANQSSTTTYIGGFSSTYSPIQWDIVELDAPMPAPLLVGNVTHENQTVQVTKYFNVSSSCTTGTCGMTEADGFSSCSFSSTGVYNCAFTNAYSAKPVCIAGTNNAWGGLAPTCQVDQANTTASNLRINCFTTGTNSLQNSSFSASCFGSK